MKNKNFYGTVAMAMMLAAMTGCTQDADDLGMNKKVLTTFALDGGFDMQEFGAMTRALTADGKAMTDLWMMDYMDGALVQQLHQTAEDEDFGTPTMALDFGDHHIYFVCSRGTIPTLSTEEHTISWATTSDTFYKDYSVSVTSGSETTRSVTLERVATKLAITILDAIPDGTSYVEITPATWYYGLDYLDGSATAAQTAEPRTITIPSSKIGATNTTLSIFGLSDATEWTTDVTMTACDADDNILGQATMTDAPFVANRVTNYRGNLFSGAGNFGVSLNDTWNEEHSGNW